MSGETDLAVLLKSMKPILKPGEYVFCSIGDRDFKGLELTPICVFQEAEGRSLIIPREPADEANISYSSTFRMITLSIHSSLHAVGFIAAICSKLARHGISVNLVSAYYHDHLFVPASRALEVMKLLKEFSV